MVGTATGIDVDAWSAGRATRPARRGGAARLERIGDGGVPRPAPRRRRHPDGHAAGHPEPVTDRTDPSATPAPSRRSVGRSSIAAARAAAVNTRLTVRGRGDPALRPGGTGRGRHPGRVRRHPAAAGRRSRQPGLGELVELAGTRSTKRGDGDHPRDRRRARKLGKQAQPDPLRRSTGALGEAQEALLVVARGEVTLHAPPHQRRERLLRHRRRIRAAPDLRQPTSGHRRPIAILLGSVVEVSGVLGQETTGKLPTAATGSGRAEPSDVRVVAPAPGAATGGGSTGSRWRWWADRIERRSRRPARHGDRVHEAGEAAGRAAPRGARADGGHPLGDPAGVGAVADPGTGAEPEPSPAPASAGCWSWPALLLGGGGVAVGPPGLAGRLLAPSSRTLRREPRGRGGSERPSPGRRSGAAPRLVPLTVVEDAARAWRAYTPADLSAEHAPRSIHARIEEPPPRDATSPRRSTDAPAAASTTSRSSGASWRSTSCWSAIRAEWPRWPPISDAVELERSNREITTATGTYRGMRLSAMSTGMGTDNVEIVLAEVMEITDQPTFIRIGSSGALQPEIALGDLIVSIGAVRLENTTDFYVHPGYPAIAHRDVVWALEAACLERGYPHHVGADRDRERVLRSAGKGRCARSQFAILISRRSCGANASRTSRWSRRHCSCWRAWRGSAQGRSVRRTHSGRWDVPGRRGEGGRGGTLHRCRAGRHPPALGDRPGAGRRSPTAVNVIGGRGGEQ